MITATINRMLITISNNVGIPPASSHPTTQQFEHTTIQELDNDPETPLVELKPLRKGPTSPVTSPAPTEKTYVVSPTLYSKDGTPNPYAKVTVSPFSDETPLPPEPSSMPTPRYSGIYPSSQYAGFSPQSSSGLSGYPSPYGRSPAGPSSWKGDYPRSPDQAYRPQSYVNNAPHPSSYSSRSAPLNIPGRTQNAQQITMRGPSNNPITAPSNFIDMRVSLERSRPLPAVPRGHRPKESTSESQRTYF
jgi:hypothetical protein